MTEPTPTHDEAVATVRDLVKDARFAMLTTVASDGSLVTRPMTTQEVEFDGDAWFFAEASSTKVAEIGADPRVNVAYAEGSYVSMSGEARIVRDDAKKRELWNSSVAAWLQAEPEDPSVVLIKVTPSSAEYWESPNKAVVLFEVARARITGDTPNIGDNQTVEL